MRWPKGVTPESSVKHERLGSRLENLSDDLWIKIFRLNLLFLLYQDKSKIQTPERSEQAKQIPLKIKF